MRKPTPRETVMLVALGVIALVMAFRIDWQSVGLGGGNAGLDEGDDKIGEAPIIRLSRLNQDPAGYDPKGRNLFEYGPPPRAKTTPRPMPPPPKQEKIERKAQPTLPPRPTTPPPPPPVRAPQPQFKYIGFMGPKDNKIAVFDAGDETLLAQVGDIVQDQFLVREFKYRKVILGYTDRRFAEQSAELEMKKPR